jgi:hypothetical protein
MRRWSTWAIAAVVALSLPLGAFGQNSTTGRMAWLTQLFSRSKATKKTDKTPVKPFVSPERRRALEKRKWLRRLEVCDKLRQIAGETGNQELARKADRLDQRAWEIYAQRTGTSQLPSGSTDVDRIQEYLEKTARQPQAKALLRWEENSQPQMAGGGY